MDALSSVQHPTARSTSRLRFGRRPFSPHQHERGRKYTAATAAVRLAFLRGIADAATAISPYLLRSSSSASRGKLIFRRGNRERIAEAGILAPGKNGRSERTDRAVGAHFRVARKPRSRQRPISSAVVKCALIVHDRCDGTTIFHLQARSNQRTGVGTRARDTRYCSISISVFRCRWPILLS